MLSSPAAGTERSRQKRRTCNQQLWKFWYLSNSILANYFERYVPGIFKTFIYIVRFQSLWANQVIYSSSGSTSQGASLPAVWRSQPLRPHRAWQAARGLAVIQRAASTIPRSAPPPLACCFVCCCGLSLARLHKASRCLSDSPSSGRSAELTEPGFGLCQRGTGHHDGAGERGGGNSLRSFGGLDQ